MVTLYTLNNKLVKAGSKFLVVPTPPVDPLYPIEVNGQIWSGKNLAIDDGGEGIYHKTVNYGLGDVEEYYYTFTAAVRVANSLNGWHIPTNEDWYQLRRNIGGNALRSEYGWSGTQGSNSSGFTALPAGEWGGSTGSRANFWTANEPIYYYISQSDMGNNVSSSIAISVRLIKDS